MSDQIGPVERSVILSRLALLGESDYELEMPEYVEDWTDMQHGYSMGYGKARWDAEQIVKSAPEVDHRHRLAELYTHFLRDERLLCEKAILRLADDMGISEQFSDAVNRELDTYQTTTQTPRPTLPPRSESAAGYPQATPHV